MRQPEDNHNKPIHTPGSVQAHGALLTLNLDLEILQASNNTQEYLNKQPQDLLGQPLESLIAVKQIAATKKYLAALDSDSKNYLKLAISTPEGHRYFDSTVHRLENTIILELEPTQTNAEVSFSSFHKLASDIITKMQSTSDLTEFLCLVVEEFRKITQFDRVMAYQFDHQGAGYVIAEAKREDLLPYLGLHYPATDIPEAARDLYCRCRLRFIPNINAQMVELIPSLNPITQEPLDLSSAGLRSFDDCCVEYHKNMGVTGLLVISLMKEQQLWGLISCHHETTKYLTQEMRKMCEFLGQIVSLELSHKVNYSELDYQVRLKSLQSKLIETISQADNFIDALIRPQAYLLDVLSATGAAVCLNNEITLIGATPDIPSVRALIEWVDPQVTDNLFYTESLPKLYSEALAFKDTASGLLLLRISQVQKYYILWFRPEVLQTVNWAGNPNDSIQVGADGSITLCPRKSFATWQEIVQLTALPWKECELKSALSLRNAIVGIVLKKAEELAKINLELEHSNRELASFAYAASHDLKEPLRGIYNFSNVIMEDYGAALDQEGIDYLQTVISLSVRMETLINALLRLSQLGQAELHRQETNLNDLLEQVIEVFRASRQGQELDICIQQSLPLVMCDPVLVNEIFGNLIANAFKYNDKPEKWVEIGITDTSNPHSPVFYVRDNGIGIPQHHHQTIFKLFKRLHSQEKYGGGTGAGLAITKKIVELHGGCIWVESTVGTGSRFYFTLE